MDNLFGLVGGKIRCASKRAFSAGIPVQAEIEQFGADGEEVVYRLLHEAFGAENVIRNIVVPHKKLYLEKDFLVLCRNILFVVEVKNWKGRIGFNGTDFYQDKENGIRKTIKSPVGTTEQFIRNMVSYYGLDCPVYGVVAFAEPECEIDLPEEMDGVALIPAGDLVSYIKKHAKGGKKTQSGIPWDKLLHCLRIYSKDQEYCKGILVEDDILCHTADGQKVLLNADRIRYLSVVHRPFRLHDKLYVTFCDNSSDTFYNYDTVLSLACLDGTYRKVALNRVRHIVF